MGLNRIRLLYLGDAALARECLGRPGGSIDVVGAIPGPGSFDLSPFDVILIEHGYPGIDTAAILKDVAARNLRIPVVIVADWDERLAVAALRLGVADYVVKSRPSFRAVYFRLNRLLAHVSDAAEFAAALDKAREGRAADAAAAADRLAQCKAELLGELCKAAANQEQLAHATLALKATEAAARHAAEQHAKHHEELERRARQAAADAAAALLDSAQHRSTLETELVRERAEHQTLARALAGTEASARQTAERHASELTAAAARFAEYRGEIERRTTQAEAQHATEIRELTARLEAELAQARTETQLLGTTLADLEAAARQAAAQHASEMDAGTARFAEYREETERWATEAEAQHAAEIRELTARLEAELAQARTETQSLSTTLAELDARFVHHRQESAAALQAAAQAQAALEAELAQEREQHSSQIAGAAARFVEYREKTERLVTLAAKDAREFKARLEAELAREKAQHQAVAQRLEDSEARFVHHRDESAAALQAAAQRQAALDADLAREKEQHNSEIADAAARFAEYREETERRATQTAEDARHTSEQHTSEMAALDARFVQHREESAAALQAAAQVQAALETERSREREQHNSEIADAAARFAEYREETERRAMQAAAQHASEIRELTERHTSEIAALDTRFAQHREESARAFQAAAQVQSALEAELAREKQQHNSEIAGADARFAEHREEAERRAAQAAAQHASEIRELTERHTSEIAALDTRFAQHREESARAFQAAAQVQSALEAELAREKQQHNSEIASADARFAEHREEAERRAAQAAENARHASEQHASEMAAAAIEIRELTARFEAELAHARTETQSITQTLADTETAGRHAAEAHASELSAAAARLEEHRQDAQRRAAQASADAAAALERAAQQHAAEIRDVTTRASAEQKALGQALADVEAAARRTAAAADAELRRAEQHYAAEIRYMANCFEGTLAAEQQAAEEAAAVRQAAFDAAVRHADEKHASEMDAAAARFEDEREQAESRAAKAAEHAAAALERVEQQFAADIHDLAGRLEASLAERHAAAQAAEREAAEYARDRAEWETATEEWIHRLETSDQAARASFARAEEANLRIRRRFEHAPMGVCCCSHDGAITDANDALARLLGYETPEELQSIDFAATVFGSSDELQWLIDRCLTSRATESVETTWRKKDGSRLIVRLLAVATAGDRLDLVAMDITTVRVLEERLRNSQRMEAVGRFGSEIAATCHNLLKHVKQEGQRWLDQIESGNARRQGELLLEEITRAEGFLRQLTVYGDEQKNVPELVDVNQVLRDLEPVLKKVAGGDVDVVLPKIAGPLNLDVDGERVERMLVNVAAYGRERMRHGGRLMIEVDSVAVDRSFVAKHPNVRPGPHVLFTVTEEKGSSKRSGGTMADALSPASPGIDLGALQSLVNDCGGHLWMMAEPQGQMMLKIHLPRRVLDHTESRVPPPTRPGRAGWINRRFGAHH